MGGEGRWVGMYGRRGEVGGDVWEEWGGGWGCMGGEGRWVGMYGRRGEVGGDVWEERGGGWGCMGGVGRWVGMYGRRGEVGGDLTCRELITHTVIIIYLKCCVFIF